MRVLSVGNMYPPHHLGGYELTWRAAVDHLRGRGHEVRVLTTGYRRPDAAGAPEEPDVHRELRWYWRDHRFPRLGPRARLRVERHNAAVLERHLSELRPSVASWWPMGGMSLSLIERVRRRGLPAVGVVADDWMVYGPRVDAWLRCFRGRPGLARAAERLTGLPTELGLERAALWLFTSDFTRIAAEQAGWRLERAEVASFGVDTGVFRPAPEHPWGWRLAYIGRLDPRKGVDLALRALAELPAEASLAVVGPGDERYARELRRLRDELGLEERVRFEILPRSELRRAYAEADAVLFPVLWDEPWGLVPLEAMAVGRPVVATGRGGSGEYLSDGGNCLLFDPRDGPAAVAAAVRRLAAEPALRSELRARGLETAAQHTQDAYNRAVEEALERVVAG